ncbi:MAG: hypothetical protein AAF639_04880 [Chloroflexota bacterium]
MNLGNIYSYLGQLNYALILFAQAEAVFQKSQDEKNLAMVYTNQGIAYRKLKNWLYAKEILCKSINAWQKVGNILYMSNAQDELGLVYFEQGCYEYALEIFNIALHNLTQLDENHNTDTLKKLLLNHVEQVKIYLQE